MRWSERVRDAERRAIALKLLPVIVAETREEPLPGRVLVGSRISTRSSSSAHLVLAPERSAVASVDLAANARRYYLLAWQPNLYGEETLIRMFGRMGRLRHVIAPPFPSLEAAWPMIRAIIRTRLRHGYRFVA